MISGRLKHRVALQSPSDATDAMGQAVSTYATVATVWAQVEPLDGREFEAAQAARSEITVKVIIRYYSGIGPRWRLVHGTHVYEVVAALNLKAGKRDLKLLCKELPAAAV